MSDTTFEDIERHVGDVRWLLQEENLQLAGDLTAIGAGTWAIHGVIPYDGEVIVAEFDTYDTAKAVLDTVMCDPLAR